MDLIRISGHFQQTIVAIRLEEGESQLSVLLCPCSCRCVWVAVRFDGSAAVMVWE